MDRYVYNLNENGSAGNFYERLSVFKDEFSKKMDNLDILNQIKNFDKKTKKDKRQYFLEYLMIGVLWKSYIQKSISLSQKRYKILNGLYKLRKSHKNLKKGIDIIRGFLASIFLDREVKKEVSYKRENFNNLLKWLKATGEYDQETKRLEIWKKYFENIDDEEVKIKLKESVILADEFDKKAKSNLKTYVSGVSEFLDNNHKDYRWKEDYFFCRQKRDRVLF
ncbi:MAG: hypothetical protein ACQERZ_04755 [Fusobacteriota bacterium]